jgi:hypothetical protein
MSDLFSGATPGKSRKTNEPHPLFDAESYPLISQLLFGVGNAAGDEYSQPPRNMTLFLEGDILKVVFGAGDQHPKLYTTLSELSGGFDSIEKQLEDGKFSWKKPDPRRNQGWRR